MASHSRKRLILSGCFLLAVLIVFIGLYFQFKHPKASEDTLNQTSFATKSFNEMKVSFVLPDEIEEEDETEDLEDSVEEDESGAVAEVVEKAEIPVAPVKDIAMAIANAKSYVYTIDTDLEQGSGFLYNSKGDIVTNAHVAKDAAYVVVTSSDGQQFNGQVIGISDQVDIALIRVIELAGKEPMAMETSQVEAGRNVFALGSPENIANTSSEGKILSTGKSFIDGYHYKDLYEMDANIKKGSSGGPLIDAETERILGINSLILEDNPNIGYAIPIYTVAAQLNKWATEAKIDNTVEEDWNHADEAFFEEGILASCIESYYELLPYSLNDRQLTYYLSYLLPGSEAERIGKQFIQQNGAENRVFDAVTSTITNVEIGEDQAEVRASAKFIYHDEETNEVYEILQEATYTIIIDQYGDYQIENIVIN